jgi:hypothetical protein
MFKIYFTRLLLTRRNHCISVTNRRMVLIGLPHSPRHWAHMDCLIFLSSQLINVSSQTIQSLDPSRLLSSDFVELSRIPISAIRTTKIETKMLPGRSDIPPRHPWIFYHYLSHSTIMLSRTVRFRITACSNPPTFATGNDLLLPKTSPWQVPLIAIANEIQMHIAMRQLLLDDELITGELLQ